MNRSDTTAPSGSGGSWLGGRGAAIANSLSPRFPEVLLCGPGKEWLQYSPGFCLRHAREFTVHLSDRPTYWLESQPHRESEQRLRREPVDVIKRKYFLAIGSVGNASYTGRVRGLEDEDSASDQSLAQALDNGPWIVKVLEDFE
jgi:hypothetical protein